MVKEKTVNKNNSDNKLLNNPIVSYVKQNAGILIGFIALCIFLTFASDSFLDMGNITNVLRQVCINGLLAFGMTCVMISGGIDLSVGSVVAASGVLVVLLISHGYPIIAAVLIAVLSGAVFGFFNGYIITKTGMHPFVVTLASQTIIRGLSYVITNGQPLQSNNNTFNNIGNGFLANIPIPVIIVLFIIIILSVILNKTIFGRHVYAIGGNRDAAKYSGINTKKTELRVYIMSAMLAAVAGIILAARMYSGQPTVGEGYEGDAIAAAVLGGTSFNGGIGSIGGTIIGVLVIGVLNNGLNLLQVSFYWQLVVKGFVIIGAVYVDLVKKKKIFAKKDTKKEDKLKAATN